MRLRTRAGLKAVGVRALSEVDVLDSDDAVA